MYGQPELRADGQLLDHELEVVVARQRDHRRVRVGDADTQRGRDGPAQRAGLAAVDPVPRLVDVQELRAGDLRQPDRADVAGVAAERAVHLLVHALRLDRDVVEVGAALQRLLALGAVLDPRRCGRAAGRGLALLGDLDEQLERRLGVGDDAVVGRRTPGRSGSARCRRGRTCGRGGRCRGRRCAGWPTGCRCRARSPTPASSRCRSGVTVCSPTMPAISWWSSGMVPQPIRVGTTGTPGVSANSHQQRRTRRR